MSANDPSNPVLPSNQRVRTSTALWSEQVGQADAEDALRPRDPAYEFTSGRKFEEPRRV